MIFATAITSATDTSQTEAVIGAIGIVLTIVGLVYVVLRGSSYKQNHITDQNTITSLKDRMESAVADLEIEKARANKLEGENKTLQDTVTAAPLIAQLTAQVTKQHTASMKWQKQTAKLQSEMLHELRTFVEDLPAHRDNSNV